MSKEQLSSPPLPPEQRQRSPPPQPLSQPLPLPSTSPVASGAFTTMCGSTRDGSNGTAPSSLSKTVHPSTSSTATSDQYASSVLSAHALSANYNTTSYSLPATWEGKYYGGMQPQQRKATHSSISSSYDATSRNTARIVLDPSFLSSLYTRTDHPQAPSLPPGSTFTMGNKPPTTKVGSETETAEHSKEVLARGTRVLEESILRRYHDMSSKGEQKEAKEAELVHGTQRLLPKEDGRQSAGFSGPGTAQSFLAAENEATPPRRPKLKKKKTKVKKGSAPPMLKNDEPASPASVPGPTSDPTSSPHQHLAEASTMTNAGVPATLLTNLSPSMAAFTPTAAPTSTTPYVVVVERHYHHHDSSGAFGYQGYGFPQQVNTAGRDRFYFPANPPLSSYHEAYSLQGSLQHAPFSPYSIAAPSPTGLPFAVSHAAHGGGAPRTAAGPSLTRTYVFPTSQPVWQEQHHHPLQQQHHSSYAFPPPSHPLQATLVQQQRGQQDFQARKLEQEGCDTNEIPGAAPAPPYAASTSSSEKNPDTPVVRPPSQTLSQPATEATPVVKEIITIDDDDDDEEDEDGDQEDHEQEKLKAASSGLRQQQEQQLDHRENSKKRRCPSNINDDRHHSAAASAITSSFNAKKTKIKRPKKEKASEKPMNEKERHDFGALKLLLEKHEKQEESRNKGGGRRGRGISPLERPQTASEPIYDVTDNDILTGVRRGKSYDHPGNREFHKMAREFHDFYIEAQSNVEKAAVTNFLVEAVHKRGGRFLRRQDNEHNLAEGVSYVELSTEEARQKTRDVLIRLCKGKR
ncbi:hypothetical protein ACA910_019768 [Epithemia clementina (nom. ined.)]